MKNAITPYTQLVKNADAAACFLIPSKPHLRVPLVGRHHRPAESLPDH